jgi:hypothetical protein
MDPVRSPGRGAASPPSFLYTGKVGEQGWRENEKHCRSGIGLSLWGSGGRARISPAQNWLIRCGRISNGSQACGSVALYSQNTAGSPTEPRTQRNTRRTIKYTHTTSMVIFRSSVLARQESKGKGSMNSCHWYRSWWSEASQNLLTASVPANRGSQGSCKSVRGKAVFARNAARRSFLGQLLVRGSWLYESDIVQLPRNSEILAAFHLMRFFATLVFIDPACHSQSKPWVQITSIQAKRYQTIKYKIWRV